MHRRPWRATSCRNFGFGDYDFTTPDFPIPSLLGENTPEILKSLGYENKAIETMIGAGVAVPPAVDTILWSKPSRVERQSGE